MKQKSWKWRPLCPRCRAMTATEMILPCVCPRDVHLELWCPPGLGFHPAPSRGAVLGPLMPLHCDIAAERCLCLGKSH